MYINRTITIAALFGGFISIILCVVFGNALFALIAAVFFALAVALWKYGYLFIPVITKATNIVEIRDSYEIPPSRDYIIKKRPEGYYCTKFLEIRFYESAMDKGENEKRFIFESFEKAVSALKYVVKLSMLISAIDVSKHIEELKTRRSNIETKRFSQEKLDSSDIIRYDREIAMLNRLLDRFSKGERPVEMIAFASTTAFGITRDEAVGKVNRQAKELKTILSSSLSCDTRDLRDLEMLKCFEWELFAPSNEEELRDEVF
ncbi:MAG: hypothetical protein QW153_03885 [Candidatus Bilamarchaeaceae archaeon]